MILRILGEGQFDIPDAYAARLSVLEADLDSAIEAGDPSAFTAALWVLSEVVRRLGRPVAAEYLGPSDLLLPNADMSLDQVQALLADEGLIRG